MGKKADWINDFSPTFDRVDGFLRINEEEAQVVRLIFDCYTKDGWGSKRITSELNRRNIKPRESKKWLNDLSATLDSTIVILMALLVRKIKDSIHITKTPMTIKTAVKA